jgi:hypothetical protein
MARRDSSADDAGRNTRDHTEETARRALKATSGPLLRSDCGQTAIRARKTDEPQEQNLAICGAFRGALGRTRTCDLLIRSQTRSRTGGDREGHRETKPRFYRQLSAAKGTGRDRERHAVVVPLWYERATDL